MDIEFKYDQLVSCSVSMRLIEELLEIKRDLETLKRVAKMNLDYAVDVDIDDLAV